MHLMLWCTLLQLLMWVKAHWNPLGKSVVVTLVTVWHLYLSIEDQLILFINTLWTMSKIILPTLGNRRQPFIVLSRPFAVELMNKLPTGLLILFFILLTCYTSSSEAILIDAKLFLHGFFLNFLFTYLYVKIIQWNRRHRNNAKNDHWFVHFNWLMVLLGW